MLAGEKQDRYKNSKEWSFIQGADLKDGLSEYLFIPVFHCFFCNFIPLNRSDQTSERYHWKLSGRQTPG
jgi:hypothetical protein